MPHIDSNLQCSRLNTCYFCKNIFRSNLQRHIWTHTGEIPYICQLCPRSYKRPEKLKRHILSHSSPSPETKSSDTYICKFCPRSFKKPETLRRHILNHFNPETKSKKSKSDTYACYFCNRTFCRAQHLRNHIWTHTKETPYACPICPKSFRFRFSQELQRHIFKHRNNTLSDRDFCNSYKCYFCNESYSDNDKNLLRNHILTHTGEKTYVCKICSRIFRNSRELKKHCLVRHDSSVKLTHQKYRKTLSSANSLRNHIQNRAGKKQAKFKCNLCSKAHRSLDNLKRHIRCHNLEKHYPCEICKKSFSDRGTLIYHKATHSDNREFCCAICGKEYKRAESVRRHVKAAHSSKRPFKCSFCEKSFNRKDVLLDHLKRHTGEKPYICEKCGKGFTLSAEIRNHEQSCGKWKFKGKTKTKAKRQVAKRQKKMRLLPQDPLSPKPLSEEGRVDLDRDSAVTARDSDSACNQNFELEGVLIME